MLSQNNAPNQTLPIAIGASLLVGAALIAALIYTGLTIIGLDVENFGNLGKPVQFFMGGLLIAIAGLIGFAAWRLWQKHATGRFILMSVYFVIFIITIAVLLSTWGVYDSLEIFVDTVLRNSGLVILFPVAYAIYWLGGRFREGSAAQIRLTQAAAFIAIAALVLLILLGDVLGAVNGILSTYSQPTTWLLTIAVGVFGSLAYILLMMGDYFGQTPEQREAWQGWIMLSPNIIGFMFFFAGPLLLSFYLSFTDSTVGKVPEVVFFQNYADVLALEFQTVPADATPQSGLSFGYQPLMSIPLGANQLVIGAKDFLFWISLRNTIMFCLLLVPLSVIPALLLSIILNSKLPGVKFFRAIYFLPSVAAVVGTALIWRWLYDPTIGYFNYIITSVVVWLNTTFGISLQDPSIEWLTGPGVVLFSIVFLSAWQVVGYNTVLFLAGLQGIPGELYEAAMIDGANRWRQFWNVTLPMLAPTTFFVMITTVVTGLQVFNEPYALFPSRPLPINATTAVFYLYDRGFARFEFGYASSIAWVLFAIIFLITLLQFRLQRSGAYDT
jgi:multiple sugar transport system permease protein